LHKPDKWLDYYTLYAKVKTLTTSAKKCGINLIAPFNWRHRFLKMASTDQPDQLSGIVEADETFFRVSQKGSQNLNRTPRPRYSPCHYSQNSRAK